MLATDIPLSAARPRFWAKQSTARAQFARTR